MAEEWVKMRADLSSDPHMLRLCNYLISNEADDYGLSGYICNEWDADETSQAFHSVADDALFDVIESALRRVWNAVNAHCCLNDARDAVMQHMTIWEVDRLARISGFGKAMQSVDWLRAEPKGLLFPGFGKHNQPACERKKAKTSTERVREFRAREQEANHDVKRDETNETKWNATRQDIREDKISIEEPPFPQSRETKSRTSHQPSKAMKDAATQIVDAYVLAVGSGHPRTRQADKNVASWLAEGIEESELLYAGKNYALSCKRLGTDPVYRKSPANFYGRKDPTWRAYATGGTHEKPPELSASGSVHAPAKQSHADRVSAALAAVGMEGK